MTAESPAMKDVRRIGAIALWADDLERTAAFYRDIVGVALEYSEPHEPENVPHYETMWGSWGEQGPVEPYLWFNLYAAADRRTSGVSLGIPVPSLVDVHARATDAGVKIVTSPGPNPFGGRSAAYEDPDGNLVVVSEP